MLDLIFLVIMIIVIRKANRGEVNDTLCNVGLVVGFLAGIFGLVQAFFTKGSLLWIPNILVMLFAFVLKRTAEHFAKLYRQRQEEFEEEYRKAQERHVRDFDNSRTVYTDENFDDPNIRFGGGNGDTWNGK